MLTVSDARDFLRLPMAETFPEYLDRWLKNTTAYGATNPLIKMPVKRFRVLSQDEFAGVRNGGSTPLGTTSDPIARNLLKNYETLIRERGEHAGFLGFGMIDMVLAAAADGKAKEALLPVCLKKAALAKSGEIVRVTVNDDEAWFVNPLIGGALPELANKHFTEQAQAPENLVALLRAQLGNRVRTLKSEGFVGLFSSQQMVIQGRFKDSRLRQGLARTPAVRAKIEGQTEAAPSKGETTDEGIEDLGMVLPCDDSQLRVVQRINVGNSLIVEGPPGTGKSQTITNIIGNALWRGENVLFVCEKRTAVAQVEERLVDSGLSGALLNLHDEDLDKGEFLEQATSPVLSSSHRARGVRPQFDELAEVRRILNDRVRHGRKFSHASTCVENREALAGLLRLRKELGAVPKLAIDNWQSLSRERLNKLLGVIAGWESLAPVIADAKSVWNKLRPEAFDGFPNAPRECETWARHALSVLAKPEELRELNATVGLDDVLVSRGTVETALSLAQIVMKRPVCHPLVIGNGSISVTELTQLRAAARRQEEIKARRYPISLEGAAPDTLRREARELLAAESAKTWDDLTAQRDLHSERAQWIEALDRDYAQFSKQIGVIASPDAKVRFAQLRAVIELAEAGCHLPRAWWRSDQTPLLAVGGWKKQLNECLAHVQGSPHPLHFSALDGVVTTHWVHVEAMAENGFNVVSYCLRFVNDRKCKFALKQIYPAVVGAKANDWERLAVHAMAARRMSRSLTEAGKTHAVLTQITIDYLATAHKTNVPQGAEEVARVERAAALVERWRARNDWFEVENPHWQTAWETANPRLLAEAKRLLEAHESLRFGSGLADAVSELARGHRMQAARIARFIEQAQTADGDSTLPVEESFAAQTEYLSCVEKLRALEKYHPLLSAGNTSVQWDVLDEILRWRDDFEKCRGARRLDLDSRNWIDVERRLREHVAAVTEIEAAAAYYFSVDAKAEFPDYGTFGEVLAGVLNGLPLQPLWLEKKKWNLRLSAYPELKTLWGKLTAGAVIPAHGQRLFCFNLLLNCAPDAEPNGAELAQALKAFREKDELLASWSVEELKERLQERFEAAQNEHAVEYGRLATLLNGKKRPAVRQMVNNVDRYRFVDYLLAAKPCWMMSPVALANLLDSAVFEEHGVPFDMVVFDEASQIPVVNGLLAMAFGRQTVIVGDTKQLPPTNFFRNLGGDGTDDDDFGVSESLLNEFSGTLPSEMLCSHYRSETPDLIRFSNDWFYKKLEFYPPAKVSGIGRRLVMVPGGVFSEVAGQRNNPAEARQVVKLIQEHVQDASEKSLGVVTMNIPQMELVEELLLQAGSAVRAFCSDEKKFFLRNLETVQGDEMDRIILSLTYGRNVEGRFNAAILGPLTKSGGERRLNVAITRSRQGMIVVSSLTSALMGTSGAQSEGFLCLKAFIEDLERSTTSRDFGISGRRFQRRSDGVSNLVFCESPFEERVVEFLEQEGYEIQCQYGSGEFRIDIVIRENERNLLAIECDGKAYHQSLVARTRDRAREAILRDRGWRIHRIWSTNWWNFEEQEKQAVRDAISAARVAVKNGPKEQKSAHFNNASGIRFVSRSEVPRDADIITKPYDPKEGSFKLS